MNLNDLLSHYRRVSPVESAKDVEELIRLFGERHLSEMASSILAEGQIAPDVVLPAGPAGAPMSLESLTRQGPVVLKFYRGRWCPYCTLELRAYERSVARVAALGGRVIALSPQSADETEKTRARDHLTLTLVTDRDNAVADRFGLAYRLDADERRMVRALGVELAQVNGHADPDAASGWTLALPALYVIGPGRRIVYRFVDPDTRRRAEPDDVVAAVAALKRGA